MVVRASSATMTTVVFLVLLSLALVTDAEQNCIYECMKLCVEGTEKATRGG
jgi:hypothetical protein